MLWASRPITKSLCDGVKFPAQQEIKLHVGTKQISCAAGNINPHIKDRAQPYPVTP